MAALRHRPDARTHSFAQAATALLATLTLAVAGLWLAMAPGKAFAAENVTSINLNNYYVDTADNGTAIYNGAPQMPATLTLTPTNTEATDQPSEITVTVSAPADGELTFGISELSWEANDSVNAATITNPTGLSLKASQDSTDSTSATEPRTTGTYYLFIQAAANAEGTLSGVEDGKVTFSGTTASGTGETAQNDFTIEPLDLSQYDLKAPGLTYTGEPQTPGTLTLTTTQSGYPKTITVTSGAAAPATTGTYQVATFTIDGVSVSPVPQGLSITTQLGTAETAPLTNLVEAGTYTVKLVAGEGAANVTKSAVGELVIAAEAVNIEFEVDGKTSVTSASDPLELSLLNEDGVEVTVNFTAPEGVDQKNLTATVAVATGGVTLALPEGSTAKLENDKTVTNLASGQAFVIVPVEEGPATITVTLAATGEGAGDITTGAGATYYVNVVMPEEGYQLKLAPDSMTYTTKAAAPTPTLTDEKGETVPADDYTILWYLDKGLTEETGGPEDTLSGATSVGGAPVNAGTYYAIATLKSSGETADPEASAPVAYTIEQADFTVAFAPQSPMNLTLPAEASGKTVKVLFAGVDDAPVATGAASATAIVATGATSSTTNLTNPSGTSTPSGTQTDSGQSGTSTPQTTSANEPATAAATSEYAATITGCKMVTNSEGKPQIIADYTFTNNSDKTTTPLQALRYKAYQNGVELGFGSPLGIPESEFDLYTQIRDVMPGATGAFQDIYALNDQSPVTFIVTDSSYIGTANAGELAQATYDPTTGKEISSSSNAAETPQPGTAVIELTNATGLAFGDSFTVIPKSAGTAEVLLAVTPTPLASGGTADVVQNYRTTTVPYQVNVAGAAQTAGGGSGSGSMQTAGLAQTGDASAAALTVLGIIIAVSIAGMVVARRRSRAQ